MFHEMRVQWKRTELKGNRIAFVPAEMLIETTNCHTQKQQKKKQRIFFDRSAICRMQQIW